MNYGYLISTDTFQYPATLDRSEDGKEPLFRGIVCKVGESMDVEIRIKTLDGTFVAEKPLEIHKWRNPPMSDKQLHKELIKRGIQKYRQDKDREFFEFKSKEEAIRIINDIYFGTRNLKTYSEREEQTLIINGVCDKFNIQLSRIEKRKIIRALINAKMRSGKCHISYKIAKKMNFKRILILTYKPNGVAESWEDDIDHIEFKDFTFKKALGLSEVKFDDNDKIQVIFASFQDAIGEVIDGEGNIIKQNKDKWGKIFNQKIDLIIKDEEHYGYETEKSKTFLSKLKYDFELALSGTPFKAILDGKYDLDEVFTWTYLQEQIKRKSEKESGWKTDVYRALPEFEVYSCKYKESIIEEFLNYYKEEEKVTNLKLFSNEKLVYDFLTWLKMCPNMTERITSHMFWYLPRVINCDIIEKVISTHPHWKDYVVVNASGDSVKDLNDTKSKIYDKKPKTITLSCGRWNTGSTVKQWNSVWMLDDGYSAENWFQTVMRSGSPWISNSGEFLKEKVHVVDFNSDRMLKCYIEYSTVVSKYIGYEPSEFATQMLNCMPIFSVDGASVVKINVDDLIEHFNINLTNYFGCLSMLDREKMDDDVRQILKGINGTLTKEESLSMNKSSKGRGKNFKRSIVLEGSKGYVEKFEDDVTKARILTNRFKNFLFVVDKISNINDIFSYKEEFKTQTGIEVDKFKILFDKGFILKEKINDGIDLFNINNEYLYN